MSSQNFSKITNEWANQEDLIRIVIACDDLYRLLSRNMDEIPDIKYNDLYMTVQNLIHIKYGAMSLINIGGK